MIHHLCWYIWFFSGNSKGSPNIWENDWNTLLAKNARIRTVHWVSQNSNKSSSHVIRYFYIVPCVCQDGSKQAAVLGRQAMWSLLRGARVATAQFSSEVSLLLHIEGAGLSLFSRARLRASLVVFFWRHGCSIFKTRRTAVLPFGGASRLSQFSRPHLTQTFV